MIHPGPKCCQKCRIWLWRTLGWLFHDSNILQLFSPFSAMIVMFAFVKQLVRFHHLKVAFCVLSCKCKWNFSTSVAMIPPSRAVMVFSHGILDINHTCGFVVKSNIITSVYFGGLVWIEVLPVLIVDLQCLKVQGGANNHLDKVWSWLHQFHLWQ